jgi:hypothetical protein
MAVKTKPIKMKPVGASEIKDMKIIREVIMEIRREKTPEEEAAHEEDMAKCIAFLNAVMAK